MEFIFFEKQEGLLCAQHCLNALLQGPYFTAVELAALAKQIDDQELETMAEGGTNTEDFIKFAKEPSNNMDDSGYFSIEVLMRALKVWNLDLVPYASEDVIARLAREDPTKQCAFICNYKKHWFTIRKIGRQWFNLNSLNASGPEVISDTYLALYLRQLQHDGFSIFIVSGELAECPADRVLMENPVTTPVRAASTSAQQPVLIEDGDEDDDVTNSDLQRALSESLGGTAKQQQQQPAHVLQASASGASIASTDSTDYQLQTALQNSLLDTASKRRQPAPHSDKMTEEEMLEAAIKMSME